MQSKQCLSAASCASFLGNSADCIELPVCASQCDDAILMEDAIDNPRPGVAVGRTALDALLELLAEIAIEATATPHEVMGNAT